ncbi:MAG: hypothetical protein Q9159_000047 [Coniocarpon cinnabarinum]
MDHPRKPAPANTSPDKHRHTHRRRRSSDVEGHYPRSSSRRNSESPTKKIPGSPTVRPLPSPRLPRDERDSAPRASRDRSLSRKRSLVRPERRKKDKDDPNYHYRKHAQHMPVQPSATGNDPALEDDSDADAGHGKDRHQRQPLEQESAGINREASRKLQKKVTREDTKELELAAAQRRRAQQQHQVPTLWGTYCHLITFWCPDIFLRWGGKAQKAQQRAWREKIGLISLILLICFFVGFLTFGFTTAVCPPQSQTRLRINQVGPGYLIIHGQAYDLTHSQHPYARGIPDGANVLYLSPPLAPLGGYDASFMFQNVNGNCKDLITAAPNSPVPHDDSGNLGWYFPCQAFKQDGSTQPNTTQPFYLGWACHLSNKARSAYYDLKSSSDVYFTWDDVRNGSRNLAVWNGDVIDLDLLNWFDPNMIRYTSRFDDIKNNTAVRGSDLTLPYSSSEDKQIAKCFSEIIKVGSIDTETIGCIASKVVLYVSLIFILSIVVSKFVLAVLFQWFISKKYAASKGVDTSSKRNREIEDWTDDIYRPAPKVEDHYAGTVTERSGITSAFLPTKSRFTSPYAHGVGKARGQPITMASQGSGARLLSSAEPGQSSDMLPRYPSRSSFLLSEKGENRLSSTGAELDVPGPSGFIHDAVVPQPPAEWQPYGYPLIHSICLVTCYSEGQDGLRTTLDSVAMTDYPNSHKLILVVCDGQIKGHGEEFTTPEIVLGMMKDHTILPDEVQAFSYVAVASGAKRHNMAKIYSGFYDYGENSNIPRDAQQRVPMMVVVKTGTPDEATKAKPGNRGKRDSQIILMSFLQKVMFDERMTELEYEMFNGIWKITGISADYYEVVLMVDADTKAFPDSLTHMCSAMVKDPEVMGLCGETKIANKRVSWVTMIQVFEYFISHHQAKSFESCFGGVTCLPGCFSMYRIKSPKGGQNYWVPILANPDIVEHYSENVVETLHDKNLLLLGEDRFLSTLMLRTFPKRKQIFVPQAVCKTQVPEEFKVLLSQRRRWINSTIHNLFELVLVRDLCGTFCFSMQFVVFIDLVGTLVLPVAICFTIYLSKSLFLADYFWAQQLLISHLVIDAIIASVQNLPIPTIPLILLALILGLPGILIVITAHKPSYIMWMLIYLISLPIWNGVLPAYAYWKFDDFSWGDTRKTAAGKVKKAGIEYEGEFDSSKITMKRWAEFEQERRLKGAEREGLVPGKRASRNSLGMPQRLSAANLDSLA